MDSFPNFESVHCSISSSVSSCPTYRCFRRQVMWSGIPISLRIFQFVVIKTVKSFSIVNEAKVDVFLELPCFLHDPTNAGNFISGSSAPLKPTLYIWKFLVHIVLKSCQSALIQGPNIPGSYVTLFFTALDSIFTTRHIHS